MVTGSNGLATRTAGKTQNFTDPVIAQLTPQEQVETVGALYISDLLDVAAHVQRIDELDEIHQFLDSILAQLEPYPAIRMSFVCDGFTSSFFSRGGCTRIVFHDEPHVSQDFLWRTLNEYTDFTVTVEGQTCTQTYESLIWKVDTDSGRGAFVRNNTIPFFCDEVYRAFARAYELTMEISLSLRGDTTSTLGTLRYAPCATIKPAPDGHHRDAFGDDATYTITLRGEIVGEVGMDPRYLFHFVRPVGDGLLLNNMNSNFIPDTRGPTHDMTNESCDAALTLVTCLSGDEGRAVFGSYDVYSAGRSLTR